MDDTLNKTIVICFLLIITFIYPVYALPDCDRSLDINVDLVALQNREYSRYQFPVFREGDMLALEAINITNIGSCTLEHPAIELFLGDSESRIETPFCQTYFAVPGNLTPGQSYLQKRVNWNEYIDSENRTMYHCFRELDGIGRWNITGRPEGYATPTSEISGYNFKSNGVYLSTVGFRVHSPLELALFDAAQQSNSLELSNYVVAVIALAIAVLSAIFGMWHAEDLLKKQFRFTEKKHYEKQKNILWALHLELTRIKRDSEGFDKELQRNDKDAIGYKWPLIVPLYKIKSVNYVYYLRNLDNGIDGKPTKELKDTLITIFDKTSMVNDVWRKLRDLERSFEVHLYWHKIDRRFAEADRGHIKVDLDDAVKRAIDILEQDFGVRS